MADKPNILVVGSINMDMVVRTSKIPAPGQTVLGTQFKTTPGGKGANQAVGVARLGGNCRFIGAVGDDAFGRDILANLKTEGIDCANIMVTPDTHTGVAMILVDGQGENTIVVASGANHSVTPDDVFSRSDAFKDVSIVLLQLELPLPTVRAAIDLARRNGCKIILDPAPAPQGRCDELWKVDILSPNVTEAEAITGRKATDERANKMVASDLISKGPSAVVLKLGPSGSLVVMADGHFYKIPPFKVDVVDTTAAGDAFNAALAVALARGDNMHQAAKFANAAGALTCTKYGAQAVMPTAAEVNALMIRTNDF